jgi:monoamine oxidase
MRRSFRLPLTRMLREAQAACRESAATGVPIDEVTELRAERRLTRRRFLQSAGGALAATAAAGVLPRLARAASQPRVVIVGGGLAGLRCAQRLWTERGLASTIYEWSDRVGGRVATLRGYFADQQIAEKHAEFISSEHTSTLSLVRRFGLSLDNTYVDPPDTNSIYWFNSGYYTQARLNRDWQEFAWALFYGAVQKAPFPTLYYSYNQTGWEWDHMSIVEWIERYIPGGMSTQFGKLCAQDAVGENGLSAEQQSALNLTYMLGYDSSLASGYQPRNSPVLAGTDEKWHVHGGNDQIVTGLVSELPSGTIQLGQQLMAVVLNSDGTYTCTFQSDAKTYEVTCDHVVLAIPFTTLRKVDLSKAGLSALKIQAINNLQLGNSCKIMLQFNRRSWYGIGSNANCIADNGAATTWEMTNYQPGSAGIICSFPAGYQGLGLAARYGLTTDDGPAPTALATNTLADLEQILPGVSPYYNGLAYCTDTNIDPHLLGAYSNYSVGQYTGFSGIEPVQEGNIHFAGEQTSIEFQGFMEGAVTSGDRVAAEILS